MKRIVQVKWLEIAVMAGLLFTSTTVFAAEATATRDTTIDSSKPATNFSSSPTLNVSGQSTALMGFDNFAQGLPDGVTANQILKATLQLWVGKESANPTGSVSVVPISTSWQGPVATYATRPQFRGSPQTIQPLKGGALYYLLIDVTEHVRMWITNPNTNHGLAVLAFTPSTNVLFDSKKNEATSHPAFLDITLTNGRTVAVCLNAGRGITCSCEGKLISIVVGGSCQATSDTGTCREVALGMTIDNPRASCCVCAP